MTDSPPAVTQRLTAVVDETLDGDVDWIVKYHRSCVEQIEDL